MRDIVDRYYTMDFEPERYYAYSDEDFFVKEALRTKHWQCRNLLAGRLAKAMVDSGLYQLSELSTYKLLPLVFLPKKKKFIPIVKAARDLYDYDYTGFQEYRAYNRGQWAFTQDGIHPMTTDTIQSCIHFVNSDTNQPL